MGKFVTRVVKVEAERVEAGKPLPAGIVSWVELMPRDGSVGYIVTPQGMLHVWVGDWIVTGVDGVKRPCRPYVFDKMYEVVAETASLSLSIKCPRCDAGVTLPDDIEFSRWIDARDTLPSPSDQLRIKELLELLELASKAKPFPTGGNRVSWDEALDRAAHNADFFVAAHKAVPKLVEELLVRRGERPSPKHRNYAGVDYAHGLYQVVIKNEQGRHLFSNDKVGLHDLAPLLSEWRVRVCVAVPMPETTLFTNIVANNPLLDGVEIWRADFVKKDRSDFTSWDFETMRVEIDRVFVSVVIGETHIPSLLSNVARVRDGHLDLAKRWESVKKRWESVKKRWGDRLVYQRTRDILAEEMAATPQPPPKPGQQAVGEVVLADIQARIAAGKEKYGTLLQTHNGRNSLWDAYQEAIDLCMYLRQEILEREGSLLEVMAHEGKNGD